MNFPFELLSNSVETTEAAGERLSSLICENNNLPNFIAMYGDLGVGKTAFVRGFCRVICPSATVKSPTFALVNEYKCQINERGIKKVCHFDMYRISGEDDLYSIGYDDYLSDKNICIAEWCELIPFALPSQRLEVIIEKTDNEFERKITLKLVQ